MEDVVDCKHPFDSTEVDIAEELCCADVSQPESLMQFTHLATMIMNEQGLTLPHSSDTAQELYIKLLSEIESIEL